MSETKVTTIDGKVAKILTRELIEADPKRGFGSFGEFCRAIRDEIPGVETRDLRLRIGAAAPTNYGYERDGASGGFAVPYEFAKTVFDLTETEDALLPLCDNTPISSNSMSFPKDESPSWGTEGPQAYWQAEASLGTQTKPVLHMDTMVLQKLLALVPVTDELGADAPALGDYLSKAFAKRIRYKINDALLFGTGIAQPVGAFVAGSATNPVAVTIAKESGQATQTLQINNLTKMLARLPPGSFSRAVWLMNGDVIPGFFSMANALSSVYLPGGQEIEPRLAKSIFGLVLGRPAVVSPHAKTFSSQGDVLLVDMDFVRVITKVKGMDMARSMELYFDAGAIAYRARFRLDAQPKLTGPLAPANGTNSLSPFVQLGAR